MSDDNIRRDIEREHRGLPPSSLVGQPSIRELPWYRCSNCGEWCHPSRSHFPCNGGALAQPAEGEHVVFRYVGTRTEHEPHPSCSRAGQHPIGECALWQR